MATNVFTRDVALKVTTKCGQFRIVAVSTKNTLIDTMRRHDLFPPPQQGAEQGINLTDRLVMLPQLANVVTLANMWATLLNHEERIRVEFHGAHGVPTAESLALGETRAFIQPTQDIVIPASIRTHRVLYGHMQPFTSVTQGPGVDPDALNLFQAAQFHSIQSDGIPTAVFFATSFDAQTAMPEYNAGVMVQPIAPSEARTNEAREIVAALQRSFAEILAPSSSADSLEEAASGEDDGAIATASAPIDAAAADLVRTTLDVRLRSGWAAHDMLAMGSGDWLGAGRVMEKARLLGGSTARRLMQRQMSETAYAALNAEYDAQAPYHGLLGDTDDGVVADSRARRCDGRPPMWLGFDSAAHGTRMLELDEATLVKTPLDFVCRCSKKGFMEALRAVGADGVGQRRAADPNMPFTCAHCAKEWRLDPADWDEIEQSFRTGA